MSGHFLLMNITDREIEEIQNAWNQDQLGYVPTLGLLQHGNVKWDTNSREILAQAIDQGIQLRTELPPHKYIEFSPNRIGKNGLTYLAECSIKKGWVTRILRPMMGLTALSQDAQQQWDLQRKLDAIRAQIIDNGATLEIYYLNGQEIN